MLISHYDDFDMVFYAGVAKLVRLCVWDAEIASSSLASCTKRFLYKVANLYNVIRDNYPLYNYLSLKFIISIRVIFYVWNLFN